MFTPASASVKPDLDLDGARMTACCRIERRGKIRNTGSRRVTGAPGPFKQKTAVFSGKRDFSFAHTHVDTPRATVSRARLTPRAALLSARKRSIDALTRHVRCTSPELTRGRKNGSCRRSGQIARCVAEAFEKRSVSELRDSGPGRARVTNHCRRRRDARVRRPPPRSRTLPTGQKRASRGIAAGFETGLAASGAEQALGHGVHARLFGVVLVVVADQVQNPVRQ